MAGFAKNKVIKDTFYYIGQPSVPIVQVPDIPVSEVDCCNAFVLKVLADNTSEELNNDKSGFLWWFNDLITTAELTLQRFTNGAWVDVASMDANTDYGTPYDYEFYVNNQGESFIGYQLEWANVLDVHGEGSYRVKCDTTDYLAVENTLYSYEYCLKTYTDYRAEGTVRIEFYLNNTLGDSQNDKAVKDLGNLNWFNSFRLPGWFGYPNSGYEKTRTQYNTGQILDAISNQEQVFELQLKMIPFFVHDALRIDMMQGDTVLISDYNSGNAFNFTQKAVKPNSGYSPEYHKGINKLSSVKVDFIKEYNNDKKLFY